MKFLITSYGSIGKRHCNNLKNILTRKDDILIYRQFCKSGVPGFKTFFKIEEALAEKPDAAIIANPTSLHIPTALKCAEKGTNLFIEKPLSNSLEGIEKLVELTQKNNLTVMVGCNMRFHPGVKKLKDLIEEKSIGKVISVISQVGQYLPDWRPNTDYRENYSAKKDLGGGVVLDLIHELDYLYWLFGDVKSAFGFVSKSSNLEIDTEDNADILLKFENGIKANVHLDYIQRAPQRNCQIIGEEGTIIWDYFDESVKLYTPEKKWQTFTYKNFERNKMYVDEMRHFISSIKNKKQPLINLQQGIDVLKIALAAKESSNQEKIVNLVQK